MNPSGLGALSLLKEDKAENTSSSEKEASKPLESTFSKKVKGILLMVGFWSLTFIDFANHSSIYASSKPNPNHSYASHVISSSAGIGHFMKIASVLTPLP